MPIQGAHGGHRPYLSIVGWTRNDGYTPNYVERTLHAVGFLVRQLERHSLPSELIVVEWNPPPDRPPIADLLELPENTQNVTVRFVTVDAAYHRRYRGWQQRGIPTVECVNVGLRRARGLFGTPKGLDTFFSDELVARIARRDLDEDCVYRCDRCDVRPDGDGWLTTPDDGLFALVKAALLQRHGRLRQSPQWKIRDLHTNGCGDFTLLSLERWRQMHGYIKDTTVLGLDADSIALHAAAAYGAREVCWPEPYDVYKIVHGNLNAQRLSTVWKPWQERLDRYFVNRGKHDFAHSLRMWLDYPRRRVRGIDSVLGPSIERNFVARATRLARDDVSKPLNDRNWGLADASLPDRFMTRAAWDVP
jgi:hypothetical protein